MNGVFLIYKESNWTSFDVCNYLRKKFQTKKVGHSGTLDPFATGLMIVCLGTATKIIPYLENYQKEYRAELVLGIETDTLDCTGKIIKKEQLGIYSKEEVESVLLSFLGKCQQIPPMYSALKKDGIALYNLAREGIEIERKPREIEIYSMKLEDYQNNTIKFRCLVSKGTYIRSLGKDIAAKLNTIGCLNNLERISIDKFDISMAKKISEVTEDDLISIEKILSHIPVLEVNLETEKDILNGKRLKLKNEDMVLLINEKKECLAIYEKKEDGYYYSKRGLFDVSKRV